MINGKAGCGISYAVLRSGSAAACCALSIGCGTRDEGDFPSGMAHFTEHTLFKGTSRRSAASVNSYLDRLGGELNAYTTKEDIVLHATTLREDIQKGVSLLLEIASGAIFPEEEVETEKGVVIDEIISFRDTPSDEIFDEFEARFFNGHPLGTLVLGDEKSVSSISSEDLRRFVSERFLPERMALTIVADIDEKQLEKIAIKLCDKYFHNCHRGSANYVRSLFSPAVEPFDVTIDKGNHEANAVLGCEAPSLYSGKDRATAILLANILGGPASNSLLNSSLREKRGWVYSVECSYTQYADTGLLAVSFGCDRSDVENCLRETGRILSRLKEAPMSEKTLKAAKKQICGQLAISSDNTETQCLSMGKSLLAFGHTVSDSESRKMIMDVSAQDLYDMSRRLFADGNMSKLVYL